MRFIQRNGVLVLGALGLSLAGIVACGDDSDGGTGGAGGSGATGGTAGRGGTAGTAGRGGTAGTAGRGGTSGSDGGGPKGGAAGTGGSAGKDGGAGTGGTAGAAGKGGAGGSGGAAGSGGTAGTGGVRDAGIDADAFPDDGPATDADAQVATANIRIAHLSPGAPAVDLCLAPRGTTTFTGPVLAGAGIIGGIGYANVTRYLTVGAAQYDIRLVAAGALNCATALPGVMDFTTLPALVAGSSVTIAAVGEVTPGDGGGQPFGLRALVDDTAVMAGRAKLRFVHASSGTPAVDVGLSGGALFTPLFSNVPFGGTATPTNGYVETAPLANAEISARATGTTTDVLALPGTSLAAGAIATAFAIGKIGSTLTPLRVLLCADNGTPTGQLTTCSIVGDTPARAHLRIAHLSPDAPAVDACFTPTGTPFSGTPLLRSLNVTTGLSYPQVTTYVDVPVRAYDVRIVLATATDCLTAAVPDTANVVVTNDLSATIAALGVLTLPDAGPDPGFALRVFVDSRTPPVGGNILLRFLHASPGTGNVDVGLGSGGAFTRWFANVPFGIVPTGTGIDPSGYLTTAALAAQTVSVRAANATTDALVVPNITLPGGTIASAFAVGGKTGDAARPLRLLLCNDTAAPVGMLTSCTAMP